MATNAKKCSLFLFSTQPCQTNPDDGRSCCSCHVPRLMTRTMRTTTMMMVCFSFEIGRQTAVVGVLSKYSDIRAIMYSCLPSRTSYTNIRNAVLFLQSLPSPTQSPPTLILTSTGFQQHLLPTPTLISASTIIITTFKSFTLAKLRHFSWRGSPQCMPTDTLTHRLIWMYETFRLLLPLPLPPPSNRAIRFLHTNSKRIFYSLCSCCCRWVTVMFGNPVSGAPSKYFFLTGVTFSS